MIRKLIAAYCSAYLMFSAIPGTATPPEADRSVHIVLLGGQSNMAGNGNYEALSDTDKARIDAIAPRVMLSLDGKPETLLAPLASNYLLEKYGFKYGFGPEIFIGLTLAEKNPDREYLLIKVSQGGTALYGAWNPDWSLEKSQAVEKGERKQNMKLYSKHVEAIKDRLTELEQQGITHEIIGMAWMQGENDAAKEVSARNYEANLKRLIAGYRTTFSVPDMPFVAGQINSRYGDFDEGPSMVRKAFVDVAKADRNVTVIQTVPHPPWADFPKHDDQVHYNHEGQKRLGTAMAEALLEMIE